MRWISFSRRLELWWRMEALKVNDALLHSTSTLPTSRRRWWRELMLGILLFLCGFLSGGILVGHVIAARASAVQRSGVDLQAALNRLHRVLDLDEEQRQAVASTIRDGLKDLREVRKEVGPQVEMILMRIREDVASVLDERQKILWQNRFDSMRSRWFATLQGKEGLRRKQD